MLFSKRQSHLGKLLTTVILAAGLTGLSACESTPSSRSSSSSRTPTTATTSGNTGPAAPTTAPARATPASSTTSSDGMSRVAVSLPTGDPRTSALTLEKVMPAQVMVGQSFDYMINVLNVSDISLDNVIVSDSLPEGFNVADSSPRYASRDDGVATWNLGTIAPGQSKGIRLRGSASDTGMISSCASVTYDTSLCSTIVVVQPELQLVKRVPAEVTLCEEIPVTFTVTNTGTGNADNVVISDPLPRGWTNEAGQREITLNVGTLKAKESKSYTVKVKTSSTGEFENTATATASNNLSATSGTTTTIVRQPVLQILKRGPESVYAGRDVTFQIAVRNAGDATAKNVVIEDTLPTNSSFVSASDNGRNTAGKVTWTLPELRPGDTKAYTVTVAADGISTIRNSVSAKADCADEVSANAQTLVEGIPGLLLECVDLADPIELGQNITYVITATNQGTAPGTNIKITCQLPASMTYVSSTGTTRGSVRDGMITFAPLASLAPGQQATWRIETTAKTAEVAQISVIMEATELRGKTMSETETTILYE